MEIDAIDHVVIYATDVEATCGFYERVLGADVRPADGGPTALVFDGVKVNVHPAGDEFEPHAANPAPGTADFCLLTGTPTDEVAGRLRAEGVGIVEGPVERTGARGRMDSVYFRDPDGNLVEIARYP